MLNRLEIFNETSVLLVSYHLYYFTDFIDDPVLKYEIGWMIIAVTLLNIVVNIGVIVWLVIKSLSVVIKKLFYKCKYSKPNVKKY